MKPNDTPNMIRLLRLTERTPEGCWNFTGHVSKRDGYAKLYAMRPNGESKVYQAHRISYEVFVGNLIAGMHIDHLCRNRRCVNPAHLEQVTPLENSRRGNSPSQIARRLGVCKRGHSLEDARIDNRGRKSCKQCFREVHGPNHEAKRRGKRIKTRRKEAA